MICPTVWNKVDRRCADGCWPWTGPRSPFGYGKTKVYIRGVRKTRNAHQVAWMDHHDRYIPTGMCVLHRCDNRLCCNPAHLFLGTMQDNTADRHAKGRDASGPTNTKTKLTPEAVERLWVMHWGGYRNVDIARELGVSGSAVRWVLIGKNHKPKPLDLASGGKR